MKPTDGEHTRIWLEPKGAPDRCWCSDNQWGDEGVEYVLASAAQPPCDHVLAAMADPANPTAPAIAYCSKCGRDGIGKIVVTPAYNPQPELFAPPITAPLAPPAAVKALEWIVAHPEESNAVVWDIAQNALSTPVQNVAEWQPIETLKPKHGDSVLGWVKVSGSFCAQPIYYSDFDRRWRIKLNGCLVEEVTDYQPIPAAPAKQEANNEL